MRDKISKSWHFTLCRTGLRSFHNRWHYGVGAPRSDQRLCFAPSDIIHSYSPYKNAGEKIGSRRTGQVHAGDWDQFRSRYEASVKYKACVAHFRDGKTWEDSGIITYMLERIEKSGIVDGCATHADILERYARLDALWEMTKSQGQLPPAPRHASDGILVHIDRNGKPLFGNKGFHRLAITKLANVDKVTVSLGIIHLDAVQSGTFQAQYR